MRENVSSEIPLTFSPLEIKGDMPSQDIQRLRESHYLDLAQTYIWDQVQDGELAAVNTFLKISDRRVKLWGLALASQKQAGDWTVQVEYVNPPDPH